MRMHIDSAGKTTLPQRILDHLGLKAGDDIEVKVDAEGRIYLQRADLDPPAAKDGLDRIRGIMKSGLSTDDIMKMTRGEE